MYKMIMYLLCLLPAPEYRFPLPASSTTLSPVHTVTILPRGSTRQQLSEAGCVEDVLQRSWTELRVRQTISEALATKLDPDDPEGGIAFLSGNAGAGVLTGGSSTMVTRFHLSRVNFLFLVSDRPIKEVVG